MWKWALHENIFVHNCLITYMCALITCKKLSESHYQMKHLHFRVQEVAGLTSGVVSHNNM